ncbi:MAG TPA: hypothetical protein VGP82_12000 [Ktedonobacterales bacterium]|jgi:hypothetical protein|nr:hypothetical protein [Ktedonobacterales bacterium]
MASSLFLSNDDSPEDFAAREIAVQGMVRLADRVGVLVSITPEIEGTLGGPLARAILVPRRRHESADAVQRATLAVPMSVFVCRIKQGVDPSRAAYARNEVTIVFWGLVEQRTG